MARVDLRVGWAGVIENTEAVRQQSFVKGEREKYATKHVGLKPHTFVLLFMYFVAESTLEIWTTCGR